MITIYQYSVFQDLGLPFSSCVWYICNLGQLWNLLKLLLLVDSHTVGYWGSGSAGRRGTGDVFGLEGTGSRSAGRHASSVLGRGRGSGGGDSIGGVVAASAWVVATAARVVAAAAGVVAALVAVV